MVGWPEPAATPTIQVDVDEICPAYLLGIASPFGKNVERLQIQIQIQIQRLQPPAVIAAHDSRR